MKFGIFITQNQIPEWKDFYLNYTILKTLLNPFKKIYKKNMAKEELKSRNVHLITDIEDLSKLLLEKDNTVEFNELEFQRQFQEQILIEIKKVEYFFRQNANFYSHKVQKINEQLEFIKKNKEYKDYSERLELALKELYKETNHLKDYIELNLKAKVKILKKYNKVNKYSINKLEVSKIIDDYIAKSDVLSNPLKTVNDISSEVEKMFFNYFFTKYDQKCLTVLKDYISPHYFTQLQSFYLGFWVGILFLLSALICIISIDYNIDMDDDYHFKSIFPMFRGYGIICLYLWLLGLNVYTWNIFNINYKLCFDFSNHHSHVIEIFQRAAAFSSIFVLMVLFYMIIRTQIPFFLSLFNFLPLEILPLICWLILIIYAFFPVKNSFNYQGRLYTLRLLMESLISIFNKIEFRHVWFTDQLTSFIGPIRDAEYTLCYYVYFNSSFEEKKELCSGTRNVVLFIGIFPHFLRILQCVRIILDSKKLSPQIWNAGKYLFAILTATFSFFFNIYPHLYEMWWITAIISTVYSFYWDIKYDFGFLESGRNYPLRNKLSFNNKCFYYTVGILNCFLRFMWVLSTSPEIVFQWIRPEFVSLIIFSMEVIRRSFWNFIRVELKHIELCKEFKVTIDIELPFKKNEKGEFIIKNNNIVDIMKMNRRLDKIKTQSLLNDLIKVDKEEENYLKEQGNNLSKYIHFIEILTFL